MLFEIQRKSPDCDMAVSASGSSSGLTRLQVARCTRTFICAKYWNENVGSTWIIVALLTNVHPAKCGKLFGWETAAQLSEAMNDLLDKWIKDCQSSQNSLDQIVCFQGQTNLTEVNSLQNIFISLFALSWNNFQFKIIEKISNFWFAFNYCNYSN